MMRTTTMCASAMRAGANPTAAMDHSSTADLSDMEYPGPVSITVTAAEKVVHHALEFFSIGPGRDSSLLCSTQLGRRDHFHGFGDLLRVLDRSNALTDGLQICHFISQRQS